jgi:hypothetical protein
VSAVTHGRHAIIKTVFTDLIDRPLVRMPLGTLRRKHNMNLVCGITHNLLCATGALAGGPH